MKSRTLLLVGLAVSFCALAYAEPTTWFATDTSGNLVQVDLATGHGTVIGPIGHGDYTDPDYGAIQDIDFGPDGILYGVTGDTDLLIRIDTATGAGSIIGPTGYAVTESMSFEPTTGLLWADLASGLFVPPEPFGTINTSTGAGTIAATTNDLEIDVLHFASDGTLYAIDAASGWDWVYTLGTTTGLATFLYKFDIVQITSLAFIE